MKQLNAERGAILFVVIALMFGLLLLVPFLIDYGSIHYTRRVTQTGADAAAHAAALSCTKELTLDTGFYIGTVPTWAVCCTCTRGQLKKICVLGIYQVLYAGWVALSDCSDGEQQAKRYAAENGTRLTHYRSGMTPFIGLYTIPRVKIVDLMPIMPFMTEVSVERNAPMIYRNLYNNTFDVQAHSRAEAYLDSVDKGQQPCVGVCFPYVGTVPTYDLEWQVRIVE